MPSRALSSFTAQGPTRTGRQKPELSAPGHGIRAASARGNGARIDKSGTSMAAPHVTGLVALLFQARGPLPIADVRALLTRALRPGDGAQGWHGRYGGGRIDALGSLQAALNDGPVPSLNGADTEGAVAPAGVSAASNTAREMLEALLASPSNARLRLFLEVEVGPAVKS